MRKQAWPRWIAAAAVPALLTICPAQAEENLARPPGTTRYGAMVRHLHGLLAYDHSHGERMTLTSLGPSVRGRALWMVTVGGGGPKRIFYLCRQHGHEPASTEGALAFLDELVKAGSDSAAAGYLRAATVYVVPMANPDGAESFLRHNARDVDLNRDWMERSQPETRELYSEIVHLRPDLMTDQHELYPDDARPDFTEAVGVGSAAAPAVIAACLDTQRLVSGAMRAEGFPLISHQVTDRHPARLAHRFAGIVLGVPTVLFETNRRAGDGRTVAERAAAHKQFMWDMLRCLAGDEDALKTEAAIWAAAHPAPASLPAPVKGTE